MLQSLISAVAGAVLVSAMFASPPAHADPDPEMGNPVTAILVDLDRFDNSGDDSVFMRCAKGETKVFTFDAKIKDGIEGMFTQLARNKMFLKLKNGESLKARAHTLDDTKRWVTFNLFDSDLGPSVRPDKQAMNGGTLIFNGALSYDDVKLSSIGAFCVTFNPV